MKGWYLVVSDRGKGEGACALCFLPNFDFFVSISCVNITAYCNNVCLASMYPAYFGKVHAFRLL